MSIGRCIPWFIKTYIKNLVLKTTQLEKELNQLLTKTSQVTTNILQKPITAPNGYTFVQAYREIFEKHNYHFTTTNSSPYILDCGSNIGLSIIYFKQMYPGAQIVAFEADKNIFELLTKNLSYFQFSNITLYNKAVWVSNTSLQFVMDGGLSGKILKVNDPMNKSIIAVEAVDIVQFLDKKVDFLKLDVEGAETEILLHIAPYLHLIDRVFIEYHGYSSKPQTLAEILELLQKNGFRYQIKDAFSVDKPFSHHLEVMKNRIFDLQVEIFAHKI